MSNYVDFKAIKSVASVAAVAARYGVEMRRVNVSHERGKCPLPAHPADDEKETFSVNAEKQVWICHSAACAKSRKGKKGGDVIELVAVMEGCSLREAGVKLGEWFSVGKRSARLAETSVEEPEGTPPNHNTPAKTDFEIYYQPLVDWIEGRMKMEGITAFEKTAYISVIGRIEELAKMENA